ncbi:hypothetical protein M427DRAFT_33366 [Gonapodya prolifera JEL478]|uniref:FYVE-type domain-containing protein n=1 Tax=Gonapodya prolifera (strain JEL478) TaxID=1344416 RepID=A0A139AC74_GONPJ|nr:hypothetical protein M427DRAFT_33366 [Gonapodya prolifera JEL478]|eukprot:KXS14184.1 hypothetical protein M427DRAFT_33366 [Gonapodya prolifera JEL478]
MSRPPTLSRHPSEVSLGISHAPQSFPPAGKRTSRVFGSTSISNGGASLDRRTSLTRASTNGYVTASDSAYANGSSSEPSGPSPPRTVTTLDRNPQRRPPASPAQRPLSFPSISSSPRALPRPASPATPTLIHESLPSTLQCPICANSFDSLALLNAHLDTDHPPGAQDDVADRVLGWLRDAQRAISAPLSRVATEVVRAVDVGVAEEVFQDAKDVITSVVIGGGSAGVGTGSGKITPRGRTRPTTAPHPTTPSDSAGVTRSLTSLFASLRAPVANRVALETNKIERRVEKLAKAYISASIPPDPVRRKLAAAASARSIEKSITPWQSDHEVIACPFCRTPFTLSHRRHHCRLCGRVVCSLPSCSSDVPLALDVRSAEEWRGTVVGGGAGAGAGTEKDRKGAKDGEVKAGQTKERAEGTREVYRTTACKECTRIVYRSRHTALSSLLPPPPWLTLLQRAREAQRRIETESWPAFERAVGVWGETPTDDQAFIVASNARKKVAEEVQKVEVVVKTLSRHPYPTPTDRRIADAIARSLVPYIQTRVLSLRILPLSPPKPPSSPTALDTPLFVSPDPDRVRDLHAQLDALSVQAEQLRKQEDDARRGRRGEEVEALREARREVEGEVERVRGELEREVGGSV